MAGIIPISSLAALSTPGAYAIEIAPPASPKAQPSNVVCMVGEFERGPVDVVTTVGSDAEFASIFGGIGPNSAGAFYKGALAYRNKPFPNLRVIRVSNSTQATAFKLLNDGAGSPVDIVRVEARSPGAWGNNLKVSTVAATDGVAGHFDLQIKTGNTLTDTLRNLDIAAIADLAEFPQSVGHPLVKVTRIALGDGVIALVADQSLASGADGTFADADYVGSISDVRGLYVLNTMPAEEIRFFFVAEQQSATINGGILSTAIATGKIGILNGPLNQTKASAQTDAALYRSSEGYTVYCYNTPSISIPEASGGAGGLVEVAPNSFMASILGNIPPGRSPSFRGTNGRHSDILSAIKSLRDTTLTNTDHGAFYNKGICALERDPGRGFVFRQGVTTSLTLGFEQIGRRTISSHIQASLGAFLIEFLGLPIWNLLKTMLKTGAANFLDDMIASQLIPARQDIPQGLDPYAIDFTSTVNQEANGILVMRVRVRCFAAMDFAVLATQIGEGVEIRVQEVQAAA